jgi:hypothetical protein
MVVVGTHPAGPLKPAAPDQAPAGEAEADNEADNEAKGGKEDDPAGIILREDISSEYAIPWPPGEFLGLLEALDHHD